MQWKDGLTAFRSWANSMRKRIPSKKSEIKLMFEKGLGTIFDSKFRGETLYGWKNVRLSE